MLNVDWRSIQQLNAERDKGFEELCSQLARWEVADHSRFIRKGNADGSADCYAVDENGSDCAWQAKYFFGLGGLRSSQVDRSARTAFKKHALLARYLICLPTHLPDARLHAQTSALAKWIAHVEKWAG